MTKKKHQIIIKQNQKRKRKNNHFNFAAFWIFLIFTFPKGSQSFGTTLKNDPKKSDFLDHIFVLNLENIVQYKRIATREFVRYQFTELFPERLKAKF